MECGQRAGDTATGLAGLAFFMSMCLHLRDQRFETMVCLVDLAREIRKVRVQVNLGTGEFSVASVAAHLRAVPSHCVSVRSTSNASSCEGSVEADAARFGGGQKCPSLSIC